MNQQKTMSCPEIERQLREASDAYYNGTPIMEDWEFDALWQAHKENRQTLPDDPTWADTILDRVGAPVKDSGFQKVKHATPMLSLDNVFEDIDGACADLVKWLGNIRQLYGPDVYVVVEPKIDGLSLELVYTDGKLTQAITRGDGTTGEDVIANIHPGMGIPLWIDVDDLGEDFPKQASTEGVIFVRGEVYMPGAMFTKLNEELSARGKKLMANPRNAASGALRLHDPEESKRRGLRFLAYRTDGWSKPNDDYRADRHRLIYRGFDVPTCSVFAVSAPQTVASLKKELLVGDYATDGLVFKVDHYQLQRGMGETSRAPRWAIAYKFQQERVTTKLLGITVQVGRTGALCPVAELEPVLVDGSVVGRATLHNEDQINRLGLQVGDIVEIQKMGAVIPGILRSVTLDEEAEEIVQTIAFGTVSYKEADKMARLHRPPFSLLQYIDHKCPACASTDVIRREEGAAVYYCQNPGCPATLAARIQHMCSRQALDIEGLGEEACDAIAERLHALWEPETENPPPTPLDIFTWTAHGFAGLQWTTESGSTMTFGESRGRKAYEAMERAKTLPLNRWLVALGIPTVGVNTAKEISRLCCDTTNLRYESAPARPDGSKADGFIWAIANGADKVKHPRCSGMAISHHLGPVSCQALVDFCASEFGKRALDRMREWGVKSDNYAPIPATSAEGPLTGKSFCVTGTLSVPRDQIHDLIKENGGTVVTGVTGKTGFLVAGDKAGSKIQKAEKLGITVLRESELKEMIEYGKD